MNSKTICCLKLRTSSDNFIFLCALFRRIINTLLLFRKIFLRVGTCKSFSNNISVSETDILLTKDLVPVINHDFRLNPAITKDSKGNWIENDKITVDEQTITRIIKPHVNILGKIYQNAEVEVTIGTKK